MMKRFYIIVLLSLLPFVLFSAPPKKVVYHKVISGNTFDGIARRYGVPKDSLEKWNPDVIPERIQVGQEIIVGWEEVVSEEEGNGFALGQGTERHSVDASSVGEQSQRKPKVTVNKKDKKDKKTKKEEKPIPRGEKDASFSWGTLLFGILLGAVFGILLHYFFFVKKIKAKHECNERDLSQRIAELCDEKTKLHSEALRLQSSIQTIEKEQQQLLDENVILGEEIDRLKSIGHEVNDDGLEKAKSVLPQASALSTVLYADAIIDDYFVKVREILDEDSVFVLQLNGEDSAYFIVCESAKQKVVANPSYLEGCEKQILGNTMQLEILSKGMAQKDASNGKWKVINKLNVIIR